METLASRLDVCQEKLLELYEKDSDQLQDQILHWHLVRWENVILYKAREAGHLHLNHQVVPVQLIAKAKACKAIEVQLALKTLLKSPYGTEPWTLRDTSQEMWDTEPKQCWKKRGYTVDVKFDGEESKTMCYTCWRDIYVQSIADDTWDKVTGHVDHAGLYYVHEGTRVTYVKFSQEAQTYGSTGTWEVHVGGHIIYDAFDPSVSSTQDTEQEPLSTTRPTDPSHTDQPDATTPTPVLGPAPTFVPPPPKRQRLGYGPQHTEQPDSTGDRGQRLARDNARDQCNPDGANQHRNISVGHGAPVIHLRGDPNKLKCLRYRLKKHTPVLFTKASSTWRWSTCSSPTDANSAFVTLWHDSVEQRAKFLATVTLPKDIVAVPGYMTMFA
ncbi:E2 protein [human papillomavirus 106]|uniref:Regulatory protein E2 n=1 Tax=human papillomavirus 106 TaxID=338326 RepID=Q2VJC4_9PAPI|nr:E2 protein [human papillomavirus 106]